MDDLKLWYKISRDNLPESPGTKALFLEQRAKYEDLMIWGSKFNHMDAKPSFSASKRLWKPSVSASNDHIDSVWKPSFSASKRRRPDCWQKCIISHDLRTLFWWFLRRWKTSKMEPCISRYEAFLSCGTKLPLCISSFKSLSLLDRKNN